MSEEIRGKSAQDELLRKLKSIGADLWGGLPASQAGAEGTAEQGGAMNPDIEEAWRQEMGKNASRTRRQVMGAEEKRSQAGQHAGEALPAPARKKVTLENLWITADETVDWTEALLHETSQDGLTGQKLWSFYHRMAPQVLAGDIEAYAEVLTTVNPLGDLTEYVSGMILRTPDADRLECVFECQPEDLEKYGRDYLGALSLRIARDLLAALPVSEVKITGNLNGTEKVNASFRREQLLKQKMAFLQPADFTEACGGRFGE